MNAFERDAAARDMFLECPECGRAGIVYYRTRRPVYCSPACKQRAYRRRAKVRAQSENVTPDDFAGVTNCTQREIEKSLGMTLYLLQCSCPRGIWSTRGNIQIGGLRCDRCGDEFRPIAALSRETGWI